MDCANHKSCDPITLAAEKSIVGFEGFSERCRYGRTFSKEFNCSLVFPFCLKTFTNCQTIGNRSTFLRVLGGETRNNSHSRG